DQAHVPIRGEVSDPVHVAQVGAARMVKDEQPETTVGNGPRTRQSNPVQALAHCVTPLARRLSTRADCSARFGYSKRSSRLSTGPSLSSARSRKRSMTKESAPRSI